MLVNTAALYALTTSAGLHQLAAAVLATEAAILNNFFINDRWTFRDTKPSVPWLRRALRYNAIAFLGLVVSVLTLAALTYLSDLHYLVANLFAIATGTLWNYAGSLRFAYGTAGKADRGRKDARRPSLRTIRTPRP